MNLTKFSEIVSRIFDPLRIFPVVFIVAVFNVGLTRDQLKLLFPLLATVNILLPAFVWFSLRRNRQISDGDISIRQERYRFFGLLTVSYLISTILLLFLGNNLSFVLNLILFILTATVWIITFKFKISGHVAWDSAMVLILNFLFGWAYMWLFLLIPIIGFSRVYLKRHTFAEVLAGGFLGVFEPYLILKFFKPL